MRAAVEHERKLEAPAGWELPDLGGEALESRVFTSVYHDTPSRSLARSGITLRRRTERGRSLWQLKLPRDDARLELEEPGGPTLPDALRMLLHAHLRNAPVAPVAELRTHRHGQLVGVNGNSAEVTIDEVTIMDARRVLAEFSEIEVEGEPAAVRSIVKQLQKAGATAAALTPKLFRALPFPERPAEQSPFETFRERMLDQLHAILANDPGIRLGGDDENVHQMRVATRRARALLRAGVPLYTGDVELLSTELKWLTAVLGKVRDLDVLLAHLGEQVETLAPPDARAAKQLLRGLRRKRTRARRTLLNALESERYSALLDGFEAAVAALEAAPDAPTLGRLAERELKKLRRQARAVDPDPPDEQLHDLRKRGKRVRYAYELAGDDAVVRRAKTLQ